MTNPADILTDDFIERVAERIASEAYREGIGRAVSTYGKDVIKTGIRRIATNTLQAEREPIHTITFEVRGKGYDGALEHLIREIKHDDWERRLDIRLVDPT